ncbi:MAG: hypothetical protein JNN00_03045 [Chitinophagaceae bacterium]|nr:hypothetical protein [Chitinophagaceae bacterium]
MKKLIILLSILIFQKKTYCQIKHNNYWSDTSRIAGIYKDEIDPRQYVKVLYKKNPNYKEIERMEMQRIIWNWNDTGFFQKFKYIDNNGLLNIFFDKDALSNNYNFRGNISLEAYLKGKEGERKIEVGPYSLVGVERKEIGIESFAPTTAAQLLFNTILEMKRAVVLSQDLSRDYLISTSTLAEDTIELSRIYNRIRNLNSSESMSNADPYFERLLNISKKTYYYYSSDTILNYPYYLELYKATRGIVPPNYRKIREAIAIALIGARDEITKQEDRQMRTIYPIVKVFSTKLDLINTYLNSFENAGPDAVNAFLTLASKDKINFNFLKTNLSLLSTNIKKSLSEADESNPDEIKGLLTSNFISQIKQARQIVNEFSSIGGSQMYSLIKSDAKPDANASLAELKDLYGIYFSIDNLNTYDSKQFQNNSESYAEMNELAKSKNFDEFKKKLSVEAARIIYKKLVYATIDLGKNGAQPGDILFLNVVWKNIDGERDSTNKSSSLLQIGKYYIRETGWKTEISESFYLVERINEPINDPNISKSNFKGAYGASIMQTFYYNENFERTLGGRILNRLQPSLGFNISYLDFYNNKDIEIGAGLQLGLFKNVFFFGSGINLHSIRGDEKKSAAYFMFGVSFTNIAAKFKNNNSEPAN